MVFLGGSVVKVLDGEGREVKDIGNSVPGVRSGKFAGEFRRAMGV